MKFVATAERLLLGLISIFFVVHTSHAQLCQGNIDIVFAIDDSDSTQRSDGAGGTTLAPGELSLARYFIQNSLFGAASDISMAIIAHSSSGRVLQSFTTDTVVLESSLVFAAENQGSNTGSGLQTAIDLHLASGRSGADKVIIFLLDSGTSDPVASATQAVRARTNGIRVYPVAFGNGNPAPVTNVELGLLGVDPQAFFRVNSDLDLLGVADQIIGQACPVAVAPTTTPLETTTESSQQEGNTLNEACQGFADILIAIDDSSSTQRAAPGGGTEVAPGQIELAEYYIQNSLLNTANINIGLIAHSSSGRVLSGFSNDSTALNASLTFTPEYSNSNTGAALSTSTDLHISSGRAGAAKFTILLINSGTSTPFTTFAQASRARNSGVYVMPVAFGNGGSIPVSNLELGLLGANNAAFFTVMSDADLITLVDSITAVVCPGAITTPFVSTTAAQTTVSTSTSTDSPTTTTTSAIPISTQSMTPGPLGPLSAAACQGFADILIAIDDSSSTQRAAPGGGTEVAPGQIELAEYYIQNSLLNTANINIGLIAHSSSSRVLSGFSNDSTALNASLTFTPEYSNSNTGAALSTSTDLHISSGRAGAAKFTILLLNSGTSTPFTTFAQASRARNSGVYVMPVAFGNGGSIPVSNLELGLLGANNAAFLTVMSDADLITLVDSITAVVCPGAITTPFVSTTAAQTTVSTSVSTDSPTTTTTSTIPVSTQSMTISTEAPTTTSGPSGPLSAAAACQGFADILIAIDDSSSTQRAASGGGTEVAPGQIELAEYYIQNSLLNTANINIGLIAHSNSGRLLSGFSNDSTALNASLTFTPEYSTSNTGAALATSTDLHLSSGRSGAAKFTILLLDEGTTTPFTTFAQASRARNSGVYVIPVGFGDGGSIPVSNLELSLLGANNAAFFTVMSDEELINLVDSINAIACPGAITSATESITSAATVTSTSVTTETTSISTTMVTSTETTTLTTSTTTQSTSEITSTSTLTSTVSTTQTDTATSSDSTSSTTQSASVTTAPSGPAACQGFADILIAIDDSSSTQRAAPGGGTQVAPGQIELAEYYIQNSLLNTANINIGLIAHSSSGRLLSDFSNDSTALNASLTFTPEYSTSNTGAALSTSTDLHLSSGRAGAAKFTILLLDSGTSNPFTTFAQASRARNSGVYVMPVGFGDGGSIPVSNLELSLLGANNANFFTVMSDGELINLVDSITAIVCPGAITSATESTTSAAPSTSTLVTTETPTISTTALTTSTTTQSTSEPSSTSTLSSTVSTTQTESATSTTAPPSTTTLTDSTSSTTQITVAPTVTPTFATSTTTQSPTSTSTESMTIPPSGPAACQGFADILIAIDDSSSTQRAAPGGGTEVAPGQIELAEYYIQNSLLNTANINIGLIAHSSSSRVLSGFSDDSTALNASLTFTPEYSTSNTGSALATSTDLHLDTGRAGAAKFTILLIDSNTIAPFTTFSQASRARNSGIYVIPVAFGNGGSPPVSTLELSLLGANNNAFFTVRNDAELINLVDSISAVVCPGPLPTELPITGMTLAETSSASTTNTGQSSTTSPPTSETSTTTAPTTSTGQSTTTSPTTSETSTTTAPTTSTSPTPTVSTTVTPTQPQTISTTAGTTVTPTCLGLADVVIAIDDSASTQRQPGSVLAPGEIELARYFVENSLLDADNINLALVAHSNTGRVLTSLTADRAVLNNALDNIVPEFSSNNLAAGLQTSIDLLTSSSRSQASKYIIFLLDSRATDAIQAVLLAGRARLLRINVIPVAFASGFFVSDLELSLLAANGVSFRRTNSDSTLINLAASISALVCPSEITAAPPITFTGPTGEITAAPPITFTGPTGGTAASTASPSTSSEPFAPCSALEVINSIAHVTDPTDEAKFIQCYQNSSEVSYTSRFCKFGTMWNNDLGTCTDPVTVSNDPCTSLAEGNVHQYDISCNAYWECIGFFTYSNATCCPSGEAFNGTDCVADANCTAQCPPPPEEQFPLYCPYVVSPAGPEYYRVVTNEFYIDKACPSGLLFNFDLCYCNGSATDSCSEDLRVTFENQTIVDYSKNQQRLTLYPMARMFAFPNDTTVAFWGPNYIIASGFANKEFRKISAVVGFEPTGATNDQVLLHNGPVGDPLGPSVKISITDSSTSGVLDVMFTLVLTLDSAADAVPLNISVQRGGPIEARLMYTGTEVTATVLKSGVLVGSATRMPAFIDDSVSLRKGAFNIGGGGCLGCNNFVGSMDYVKVFDCVADAADLGESPAVGLQDILTPRDTSIMFPTPAAQYLPAATTPSQTDNLAQCTYAEFFNGIAHVPYSGDCGKFLHCEIDNLVTFNVTVKDCPFGTMWSSGQEACSRPFEAECDPCKGTSDNARFPYPRYCQAYLQCAGGVSEIKCCADNEIYNETSGCVVDTLNTCNNTCTIEPDPAYLCFLTNSSQGEGFYYDQVAEADFPCPPGLGFNTTECACSNVIGDTTTTCSPYIDIGFDFSEVVDLSSNKFQVDSGFIAINGNVGDFSDNRAFVIVFGTANVEYFGSQFGMAVNFTAPSSVSGNQTLVYNGAIGSETASIQLSIRSSTSSTITVSFLILTEADTSEITLDMSASSTGAIYTTVIYDGLKVTAKTVSDLGTQVATRAATGNVLRKQGAVNIGSGLCFGFPCDPFSGQITSVKMYLCTPTF
ncbi:hypothetical protein RRG08_001023 [Elysia crispata]|uniref:Chitinase n=1 Tax=Elysia crispata TaxID=231223 RepID=A0AAE1AVP7_9GAST|nr:hypothetical protein RRG08_001023 [Elysia crispata]KAK3794874.1 hypothetical protein RRG08_001023 [Elysia crispata]KAK3794875.1 hypothetical protein RRG08_001023 [Elysia crispata]